MHHLFEALRLVGPMLAFVIAPSPPPGFGVWGGGTGPQGLRDSTQPLGKNTGGVPPYLNKKNINRTFKAVIATTGVPQPLPPVNVENAASVAIRGYNGTTGNAQPVWSGLHRESVTPLGQGDPITPDTEINYPVDNLGQIWICGTAGDGVVVSIRATGFGG